MTESEAREKQTAKKPIFDYNLSDTLSKFHCECGNIRNSKGRRQYK